MPDSSRAMSMNQRDIVSQFILIVVTTCSSNFTMTCLSIFYFAIALHPHLYQPLKADKEHICDHCTFLITREAQFEVFVALNSPTEVGLKPESLEMVYGGCVSGLPISIHVDCLDMAMRKYLLSAISSGMCQSPSNITSKPIIKLTDKKIKRCKRKHNHDLWLIDYSEKNETTLKQVPDTIEVHVHAFEGYKLTAYCSSNSAIPNESFRYGEHCLLLIHRVLTCSCHMTVILA